MKNGFVQSMAWLHTWGGLVIGWLLFVIFVGGTIACFDAELDRWARPGLSAQAPAVQVSDRALDTVARRLDASDGDAHAWFLYLPSERYPAIRAGAWHGGDYFHADSYDPTTGEPLADAAGGEFFFKLHYDLHAGTWGMYLVGLAGMFMLVAIITGTIIHRRIFKDFFLLRSRAGGQRAWLDGHNVTGVLGWPFHLMIAYTGVAIFVASYMLAGVQTAYKGDIEAFWDEAAPHMHRDAMDTPIPARADIAPMIADARERLQGEPWLVSVEHPDDASRVVSLGLDHSHHVAWNRATSYYDGVTGAHMADSVPSATAFHVYQFIGGLHMAQFGGGLVRWLYFVLGLSGCVMLACGMQVWVEKRAKKVAAAGIASGYGLVRALNVGVVAGMPLAVAAMAWANRLLPAQLVWREGWEITVFCIAWAVAASWGLLRLRSGRAWRDLFAATAVLMLGVPVLTMLVAPVAGLHATLPAGDWAMAGVDLTLLALGAAFAWLARLAPRRATVAGAVEPAAPLLEAEATR